MALALMIAPRASLAVCGDITGDGTVNVFDALQALQSDNSLITLDTNQMKRGDVVDAANPGNGPDGAVNVFDALRILQADNSIIANLSCNETNVVGTAINVPIQLAAASGDNYKGFQTTVSVTGGTINTATTPGAGTVTWNTCRMSNTTGKVLCVDTSAKVSSGASPRVATVSITPNAAGTMTVTFGDVLVVNTSGTTASQTDFFQQQTFQVVAQ